jgi:hypothetical protein
VLLSEAQILLCCVAPIILEVNHLKWSWWTYWERSAAASDKDCDCSFKWVMFL